MLRYYDSILIKIVTVFAWSPSPSLFRGYLWPCWGVSSSYKTTYMYRQFGAMSCFIPLPKKRDLKECANHRTISLICHASKILLKVIGRRMKIKLQAEISDEQAGFREGRGTREQIVNIRYIIEKCREHCRHPLYLCFIDYSKALDFVWHSQMWNTM